MVRTDPKIQKLDKFLSSTLDPDGSHIGGFNDTPSRIEPGDISIIENISKTVNSSSNVSNLGLSNRYMLCVFVIFFRKIMLSREIVNLLE